MTAKKPWRTPARPIRPNLLLAEPTPALAQITIYERLVLVTRCEDHRGWRQYAIDPAALAQTFADVPVSSGPLPPGTLAAGTLHGHPFLVLWLPPHRLTLHTLHSSYDIPLPALVWAGWQQDYRIFALDQPNYPRRSDLPLFVAPFPNVYRNGSICWGSADPRPAAGPHTLGQVLDLFLTGSLFNLHVAGGKSVRFPGSVLAMWADLVRSQAEHYPPDDLIPAEAHLSWLIRGSTWKGTSEATV